MAFQDLVSMKVSPPPYENDNSSSLLYRQHDFPCHVVSHSRVAKASSDRLVVTSPPVTIQDLESGSNRNQYCQVNRISTESMNTTTGIDAALCDPQTSAAGEKNRSFRSEPPVSLVRVTADNFWRRSGGRWQDEDSDFDNGIPKKPEYDDEDNGLAPRKTGIGQTATSHPVPVAQQNQHHSNHDYCREKQAEARTEPDFMCIGAGVIGSPPPPSCTTYPASRMPMMSPPDRGTTVTPPMYEDISTSDGGGSSRSPTYMPDLAGSPLTASSLHVLEREYDMDTWRMYNRIASARMHNHNGGVARNLPASMPSNEPMLLKSERKHRNGGRDSTGWRRNLYEQEESHFSTQQQQQQGQSFGNGNGTLTYIPGGAVYDDDIDNDSNNCTVPGEDDYGHYVTPDVYNENNGEEKQEQYHKCYQPQQEQEEPGDGDDEEIFDLEMDM